MNDHEAEHAVLNTPSTASTTGHPPTTGHPGAGPPADLPQAQANRGAENRARVETPKGEEAGERLQKLIARAGVASRRAAEDLIREGRVSVNGHVVTELGLRADPTRDRIIVDGHPLIIRGGAPTVVLLHKPKGYITSRDDPEQRDTVLDLLPVKYRHLHPIGRLDYDTSGVLLLTDDGELTHLLTHPSHGVEKVYHARVRGRVGEGALKRLENGVVLDGQKTAPCRVRVRVQTEQNALVELTLREGRYRQVRRMLEAVGHPVSSLRRIRFDELDLEGLPSGAYRVLLPGEVASLRKRVAGKVKARSKTPVEPRASGNADKSPQAKTSRARTASGKTTLTGKPPARARPVTKSKALTRARPEEAHKPKRSGTPAREARRPAPPQAGSPEPREETESTAKAHPLSQRIERQWNKRAGQEK